LNRRFLADWMIGFSFIKAGQKEIGKPAIARLRLYPPHSAHYGKQN